MNQADREHWIREQQAKAAPAEPAFTSADVQRYQQAATHIIADHPELADGTALKQALDAGFDGNNTMHPKVIARAVKEVRPDFQAHIFSERGRADLHALNNVKDNEARSIHEYERIIGWIDRNGLFARPAEDKSENAETDAYIIQRRRDFMHGIRRR